MLLASLENTRQALEIAKEASEDARQWERAAEQALKSAELGQAVSGIVCAEYVYLFDAVLDAMENHGIRLPGYHGRVTKGLDQRSD